MESEQTIPALSKAVKKRIVQTSLGRDTGWLMQYKNQPVATLTNCQFYDMFWDLYDVTYLIQDEAIISKLQDQNFWYEHSDEVTFRNQEFTDFPPVAPIIVVPQDAPKSIMARGLYLSIDTPPTKLKKVWMRVTSWLGLDVFFL